MLDEYGNYWSESDDTSLEYTLTNIFMCCDFQVSVKVDAIHEKCINCGALLETIEVDI